MDELLERFLRYVRIDTQSDETSPSIPSTAKQLDLSRLLAEECREMGLEDVTLDEFGVVMATIPATVEHTSPTMAWVAHVDTSPEYSGTGVNPQVHRKYDGGDITVRDDPEMPLVLRVNENPDLRNLVGGTIITTDGTTLLGADDKSGIAVMMTAAGHLILDQSVPHGPIRLCFTCDEEIGRGVEHLDLERLNADVAYTLDSEGVGRIDSETFSADQAVVVVHGINTHPSVGKDKMVNAIRLMSTFLDRLPTERLCPEKTDGREGFIHPYHVEGGVAKAEARLILRDFETARLAEYAQLLQDNAAELMKSEPRCKIEVIVRKQYRNMRDGLLKEPRAIAKATDAIRATGIEPRHSIIRGGTDGSLLTERGLPTPNLSSGQHNPHSPLEWTSLEEMRRSVEVLIELARAWGAELAD